MNNSLNIIVCFLLIILVWLIPCEAQIYVNDDNISGPWDGSRQHPFKSIADGIVYAQSGGEIRVAQGDYQEYIALLDQQTLTGGYSDDWQEKDWEQYITTIRSTDNAVAAVTMASGSVLDGFHIVKTWGALDSSGIKAELCQGFMIQNCRLDVKAIIYNYLPGANGISVNGITLLDCDPGTIGLTLHDVRIDSVRAGHGSTGDFHYTSSGGDGGIATGLKIVSCPEICITDLSIMTIMAGSAGSGCSRGGGNGGVGGSAIGIDVSNSSFLSLENCFIQQIQAGHGGYGIFSSYTGGGGGNSIAMRFSDCSDLDLNNLVVNFCIAGIAGHTYQGGLCGSGGNATGIGFFNTSEVRCSNSLITQIFGGAGNLQNQESGEPGNGGDAIGFHADTENPEISNLTISRCMGGHGGLGSEVFVGGTGGNSYGMVLSTTVSDSILYNITTDCHGGYPGPVGGIAGLGVGIASQNQWLDIHYSNLWNNDLNYSGCGAGPGSFSLDPLFATRPGYSPYYLSHVDAGQMETSPCTDAAPIAVEDIFPLGDYTTRTDHVEDTANLDYGFHMMTMATPLPTSPPSPTPFSTPTCPPSSVVCRLNQNWFEPGDPFVYTVDICNGTASTIPMDVYAVLDVMGLYWFYPGWSSEIDHYSITLAPCECLELTVLEFVWPEVDSPNLTVRLWSAAVNQTDLKLFEDYCTAEFGY